jgi:hypothetical protein
MLISKLCSVYIYIRAHFVVSAYLNMHHICQNYDKISRQKQKFDIVAY